MLNQATLDKLHALRLTGMAEAYQKQLEEPEARGLRFEERFGMLVDNHWTWRENQALSRRLKKSRPLTSSPIPSSTDRSSSSARTTWVRSGRQLSRSSRSSPRRPSRSSVTPTAPSTCWVTCCMTDSAAASARRLRHCRPAPVPCSNG